jgi:hypothetical protein
MSNFQFKDFISDQQENKIVQEISQQIVVPNLAAINEQNRFFDLDEFINETYTRNTNKNKEAIIKQKYMSSYDVASSCISNIIYKIRNTPIKSYASKWLPIVLRSYLGNAVHSFIQNSNQFTEQEVSLKIPSIRVSGRLDCLINNDVLVEVKSLPYKEYKKIIKSQTPRINDFYQTILYKYLLENHLEEAKNHTEETRSQKPKLDYYNIRYLQFIYVVHDIMSSDIESLEEALACVDHVKKVLNSKSSTFYFMTNMLIDLNNYDLTPYIKYITGKIQRVNYYIDNNLDVAKDDEYVDPKACFFCLYPSICPYK